MKFGTTNIVGLMTIALDPRRDERGFFMRTYCADEFEAHGLNTRWVQCNLSYSDRRGTVRGLHFQAPPAPEFKLIRIGTGAVFGAAVDLRPDRGGFGRCWAGELSAADGVMIYVPAGCAFGFQTLADHTEVNYQMSDFFQPELARGVRWNDPELGIAWPLEVTEMSDRDKVLPTLRELAPVYA